MLYPLNGIAKTYFEDWLFLSPQFLIEVSRKKNAAPLPLIPEKFGPRLPPERYCLTANNYTIMERKKPVSAMPRYKQHEVLMQPHLTRPEINTWFGGCLIDWLTWWAWCVSSLQRIPIHVHLFPTTQLYTLWYLLFQSSVNKPQVTLSATFRVPSKLVATSPSSPSALRGQLTSPLLHTKSISLSSPSITKSSVQPSSLFAHLKQSSTAPDGIPAAKQSIGAGFSDSSSESGSILGKRKL